MAPGQELQVQEKRELPKKDEPTIPARTFVPTTDIYETDQALTLVMEMPGVDKGNIDISVENVSESPRLPSFRLTCVGSGGDASRRRGLPVPRQQFCEPVDRV